MTRDEKLKRIAATVQEDEKLVVVATAYWRGINKVPDGHEVYEVTKDDVEYKGRIRHESFVDSNFAHLYAQRVLGRDVYGIATYVIDSDANAVCRADKVPYTTMYPVKFRN